MNPANTVDLTAIRVTAALLALQVGVLVWVWRETLFPLGRQRVKVATFKSQVERSKDVVDVARPTERRLARAWDHLLAANGMPNAFREAVEPRDAFAPDALIPNAYNARFDSAAPGLFTALGIVGTFLGLIIAFGHVDPAQSQQSIAPLVGGMRVAFWNSLGGVVLSILWTVGSRRARHAFDRACRELTEAAESRLEHVTAGGQVLQKLESVIAETRLARIEAKSASETLAAKLDAVTKATQNSSTELLDTLAPQLEKSFKSLVDTPFENLSRTVEHYRQTVEQVAERHGYVLDGLDAAVAALGAAQTGLAAATADTARCVLQFEEFVERVGAETERSANLIAERSTQAAAALEAQTVRAAAVVEQGSETAHALASGVGALRETADRQSEVATVLGGVTEGLRIASADLDRISSTFGSAATRLENAVGQIQQLGTEAAQDTARAARDELQFAVSQMSDALRDFGAQNIAAYEASSRGVIAAVDGRMSDLIERLSAELNTLTVRLPEVGESMTAAAKSVRAQLERAVRGLDDAVRQLDVASRQSLKARLEEYDGAVAKAVDHFSGTLLVWDGRVGELTGVVRQLESAVGVRNGRAALNEVELIVEAPRTTEATLS